MWKKVLSLFSGCGGMDLGFEGSFQCLTKEINTELHPDWIAHSDGDTCLLKEIGFTTVFANDIREDAMTVWTDFFSNRHPDADNIYHLKSVVDLVKEAKNGNTVFPENIDVVIGGFPCNDFSVAGKRLGFNSDKSHTGKRLDVDEPTVENRGQLYMWMREVISIVKPNLFIAENVKGLVNLGDVKEVIEKDFAEAADGGYLVIPAKVLYAPDYGVPQSRERVIFFGFKKSQLRKRALVELSKELISQKYDPYPIKTHGPELHPYVSCADAFINLVEPEQTDDSAQKQYSKAKYLGSHCQGQTEINLNKVGPTIRAEHHGNIEFRRLSEEHGGKNIVELQNGLPERRLTVRECARLQTFPDNFRFVLDKKESAQPVSGSSAYRLIGNAVPPLLAYHIAMRIQENWELYFQRK